MKCTTNGTDGTSWPSVFARTIGSLSISSALLRGSDYLHLFAWRSPPGLSINASRRFPRSPDTSVVKPTHSANYSAAIDADQFRVSDVRHRKFLSDVRHRRFPSSVFWLPPTVCHQNYPQKEANDSDPTNHEWQVGKAVAKANGISVERQRVGRKFF